MSRSLQVTVSRSSSAAAVHVTLCGAVDLAAATELHELTEHIRDAAPRTVVMDLAGVTFACSTLANVLVRIRRSLPDQAVVAVIRPTGIVRLVLAVTGLDWVTILEEVPQPDSLSAARSGAHVVDAAAASSPPRGRSQWGTDVVQVA